MIQLCTWILSRSRCATDHVELVEFSLRCRLCSGATDYGEILEVCSCDAVRTTGDLGALDDSQL